MTPAQFRTLAAKIAGPHWKGAVGPKIGKGRSMVYEYANGVRPVPRTVQKLMRLLAK